MNIYRVLPANLSACADATEKYLRHHVGVSSIKIEEEIHPDIDFRPTLHAMTRDKHIVCAEIVDKLFDVEVERFVLQCKNKSIPVKLYVAIQKGAMQQIETQALKFAGENGVAILEVSPPNRGALLTPAPLSLSLGGVRAFRLKDFPPQYRDPLRIAIDTFRQGNPVKGCSQVYDEIEGLTRRIGKKCQTIPSGLKKPPNFDWGTVAWATTLEYLKANISSAAIKCPELKPPLLSRLIGMTEYRNEAGHKISSLNKLIVRDRQARTRFESAVDELATLIKAAKNLGI